MIVLIYQIHVTFLGKLPRFIQLVYIKKKNMLKYPLHPFIGSPEYRRFAPDMIILETRSQVKITVT